MNQQNLSSFIWSVADLLRGDYKQSEYGKVILPFTVLRRLDCVLELTKADVLKELEKRQAAGLNPEPFLLKKCGQLFYNTSPLDMKKLMGDLRALAKIAVNAVSHYCPRSTVNQEVIRVIRGLSPVSQQLLAANGFVNAADVLAISAGANAHSMRILHWNGEWCVWTCFFGGRLGTFVRFPGRNRENWSTADIVAPIGSSDWTVKKQKLTLPLRTQINWFKFERLVPSFPLLHSESRLNVEPADSRQQGK